MPRRLPFAGRPVLLAVVALGLLAPAAGAAERTFRWSGYRWTVRATAGRADPGSNRWGDTRENVRVRPDRKLRVDIAGGRAVEIIGPPTGYGRYRWVVETDLRPIDPFRVAAFFVRGTGGEQDVEFSRWGDPALSTVGSWVSWRGRTRLAYELFGLAAGPPYVVAIDWQPARTRYMVCDAAGAAVIDASFASSRAGRHVAPRISYWLYPGHGLSLNPFTAATVHPPVIVRSFSFTKRRGRAALPACR